MLHWEAKKCFYSRLAQWLHLLGHKNYIKVKRIQCFFQKYIQSPSSTCYRTACSVPSKEAKCILKTYKISLLHFFLFLFAHGSKFFKSLKRKISGQSFPAFKICIPSTERLTQCQRLRQQGKTTSNNDAQIVTQIQIHLQTLENWFLCSYYDTPLFISCLVCSVILPIHLSNSNYEQCCWIHRKWGENKLISGSARWTELAFWSPRNVDTAQDQ